jgi:hypothetical protein
MTAELENAPVWPEPELPDRPAVDANRCAVERTGPIIHEGALVGRQIGAQPAHHLVARGGILRRGTSPIMMINVGQPDGSRQPVTFLDSGANRPEVGRIMESRDDRRYSQRVGCDARFTQH